MDGQTWGRGLCESFKTVGLAFSGYVRLERIRGCNAISAWMRPYGGTGRNLTFAPRTSGRSGGLG
jgi:hypothetical protein